MTHGICIPAHGSVTDITELTCGLNNSSDNGELLRPVSKSLNWSELTWSLQLLMHLVCSLMLLISFSFYNTPIDVYVNFSVTGLMLILQKYSVVQTAAIQRSGAKMIQNLTTVPFTMAYEFQQQFRSCWDGRPCQSSGPKSKGLLCPFPWGELGPHVTCGLVRGLPPYQVASWSVQLFGHNTPTLQAGQTDRTGQRCYSSERTFTNGRLKMPRKSIHNQGRT